MSLRAPWYRAAWVPTGEPSAADLAVSWTQAVCDETGRRGTLLAGTHADDWEHGPTGRFVARNGATTPRSSQRGKPANPPLLVALPDASLMCFATRQLRDGDAVCLMAFQPWAAGWAEDAAAVDLTTGDVTPDTRTADHLQLLDDLADSGYNGWTTDSDARRIGPLLDALSHAGVDNHRILGAMVARGASDNAIRHLTAFLSLRR